MLEVDSKHFSTVQNSKDFQSEASEKGFVNNHGNTMLKANYLQKHIFYNKCKFSITNAPKTHYSTYTANIYSHIIM